MSLFTTAHIGELTLQNRIVMAPLGRARNSEPGREPQHRGAVYYAQRASAGLLISEATHVSEDSISRPDETTFYSGGDAGYIDYSTLAEQNALAEPATS